ncbi:MAG: DUF3426 domain-containing protein [Thaumarchaeota archaeon]|nr:DUF3426 domain-containing protein [Nitrososphaerota archaeon]
MYDNYNILKKYLLLLPLLLVTPEVFAQVSIQNDQKYIGDDEALHIVGEIYNGLEVPLNQIQVKVVLYSSDNQKVDEITTTPLLNTIMPEMKAPFDLVITGKNARNVDSYSLDIDYKMSYPKNQVIEITSSEYSRDKLDNTVISGKVANRGDITANTVVVVATLYDLDGNVVAVSKAHAEPDYLRTNDEMFFFVTIPDKSQASKGVNYALVAESEEYAAVPEFPLGSVILLASSVSAYILFTKYSSRFVGNIIAATNSRVQ